MPRIINAQGLACPQPVLLTQQAMAEAGDIVTIVDGPDQAENVAQMARQAGWAVQVDGKEEEIYVRLTQPRNAAQEMPVGMAVPAAGPLVLVVPGDTMGRGESPELGVILIRTFFHTLAEGKTQPDVILFFNTGVKLVAEGSPVLEDLQSLAGRGVQLLACGTCLGYFELKDKVAVGTISNMVTIAETMLTAGRVVSL
jgi:selenium metabolism protein YedF